MEFYKEAPDAGNEFRKTMLEEVEALVSKEQSEADKRRQEYFQPDFSSLDSYQQSTVKYRNKLKEILGWPLTELQTASSVPKATHQEVAEDSLSRISRVFIETLPGVHTYGIFFRPHGNGPFPLAIAQHGGGGTPELISNFFGSGNYNNMTQRLLKRGIAVFAPQLLLWNSDTFGPKHERDIVDRRLKQVGGSLAALELYRIFRSLDYFSAHKDIDSERIGMIGLSYGGFYTLFASALDMRIKAAVSSCFFNNRKEYNFVDWVWFNSANYLLDDDENDITKQADYLFPDINNAKYLGYTNEQ